MAEEDWAACCQAIIGSEYLEGMSTAQMKIKELVGIGLIEILLAMKIESMSKHQNQQ